MRFIKVDRLNETCYFNPQKITKLFISDDIITIFFENETLEIYKKECKQRRYIFVLVRNYADLTKYTPEEAREILTIIYCHQNSVPSFSLSDCSQERASDFIEFILKYTEEWGK